MRSMKVWRNRAPDAFSACRYESQLHPVWLWGLIWRSNKRWAEVSSASQFRCIRLTLLKCHQRQKRKQNYAILWNRSALAFFAMYCCRPDRVSNQTPEGIPSQRLVPTDSETIDQQQLLTYLWMLHSEYVQNPASRQILPVCRIFPFYYFQPDY